MKDLTHLSLFSGIGGLDLAAEWAGFTTVGQCELAEYPTKVLEKHWPDVPRWRDIRALTGESFYEQTGLRTVDIISGGFPCQPFSVAGKRRGEEDDRYLWPEMVRVIKELRPTWIVGENVAGIVKMALSDILSELEACEYRTRTFAVGARHRRYRVAIVGYSDSPGCKEQYAAREPDKQGFSGRKCDAGDVCNATGEGLSDGTGGQMEEQKAQPELKRPGCNVPDTDGRKTVRREPRERTYGEDAGSRENIGSGKEKHEEREWQAAQPGMGGMADGLSSWMDGNLDFIMNHYWETEPDIPRLAEGVKNRVGRLKALGNAVVPQQFYPIFKTIADWERMIPK